MLILLSSIQKVYIMWRSIIQNYQVVIRLGPPFLLKVKTQKPPDLRKELIIAQLLGPLTFSVLALMPLIFFFLVAQRSPLQSHSKVLNVQAIGPFLQWQRQIVRCIIR
jgi:hypothetical protein